MRAALRKQQRQALRGWLKWTPALAFLFSVLFFDVWLNAQERSRDYENRSLTLTERELDTEMMELRNRAAELEKFDRLDVMALEFGLKEPEPNQIKTIRYTPTPKFAKERPMAVAALRENTSTDKFVSEPFE